MGANYEEHQQETGLDIPVDLVHFKKFPVVDPPGTYKKEGHDTRWDIAADDRPELPDYGGPFQQHLRFSDFSNDALINMLGMSDEYYRVCIEGWADRWRSGMGATTCARSRQRPGRTRFFPNCGP